MIWLIGVLRSWRTWERGSDSDEGVPGAVMVSRRSTPSKGSGLHGRRDAFGLQQGLHLSKETRQIDGLRVEIIAARGKGPFLVGGHGVRGQGNEGHRLGGVCGLDLLRGLPAVDHGKTHV